MPDIHDFQGKVLDPTQMMLGEWPSFDPITNTLCWLNILGKELHALDLTSNTKTVHALPFMASVVARIDDKRQLLASDEGLFIRDRATGELSLHADFEPGKPGNRSFFGNPKADELIEKGRSLSDPEARKEVYSELNQIIYENCTQLYICHPLTVEACTKYVEGFVSNKDGYNRLWTVKCLQS